MLLRILHSCPVTYAHEIYGDDNARDNNIRRWSVTYSQQKFSNDQCNCDDNAHEHIIHR